MADIVLSLHLYSNAETRPHIRNTFFAYYSTNIEIFEDCRQQRNALKRYWLWNNSFQQSIKITSLTLFRFNQYTGFILPHRITTKRTIFQQAHPFFCTVKLNPKNTDESHITPSKSQTFEQLQNYRYRNLKPIEYSKHTFVF